METASTSSGGRGFSITVTYPDVSEVVQHIQVEQDQIVDFLQDAENLKNKATHMY